MESQETPAVFDSYYYAHGCGLPYKRDENWFRFFGTVADHILREINPRTVLDAGCAFGFLVELLRKQGVEAYGIDISEYAIQNVAPEVQPYCRVGSITDPFPQKYDLIVSIEVLEHMPKRDAERAIENICRHTDDVLFSSSPFDYKEATHYNVQPPEYWVEQFARQGFIRDVDFDAAFITAWAVRFRRNREPLHRILRDQERRYWQLSKENADLRSLVTDMRNMLSHEEYLRQLQSDQVDAQASVFGEQIRASDKQISQREAQIAEQTKTIQQLEAQIAEQEQQIQNLTAQVGALQVQWDRLRSSPGGEILQRLQRVRSVVAPPGSLRSTMIDSAWRRIHRLKPHRPRSSRKQSAGD